MTRPFFAHGHGEPAVDQRRRRQLSRPSSRRGRLDRREQLEQLRRGSRPRRRPAGTRGRRSRRRRRPRRRRPSPAAALVSSLSEFGVRMISSASPASSSTLLVTVIGKATCRRPRVARAGARRAAASGRPGPRALLVDEVEPLAGLVEDGAEVGADRGDEPLQCARSPARSDSRSASSLGEEAVRRDRLDAERADDERQHERGRRVAVVDDDPERRARIASTSSESSRSWA